MKDKSTLAENFFTAAVPEEAEKIMPVVLLWLATRLQRKLGFNLPQALQIRGPVDGIMLGFASAAGFTALEGAKYGLAQEHLASAVLQILLRSVGHFLGHGTYSAVFGYYVGLAALRPRRWQKLIGVGGAIATSLHTIWNSYSAGSMMLVFWVANASILFAYIARARRATPGVAGKS